MVSHFLGVEQILRNWSAPAYVQRAGLFHSVYSTSVLDCSLIPLTERDELKSEIGVKAENLVYLFCARDLGSFDRCLQLESGHEINDRFTGATTPLTVCEFRDLCSIDAANWLEQSQRINATPSERAQKKYTSLANCLNALGRQQVMESLRATLE